MTRYEQDLIAKREELHGLDRDLTVYQIFDYCIKQLPENIRKTPWKFVNHGVDLLSSETQLNAYNAAYGDMHQTKLLAAFQRFDFEKLISNFEIVDWGCGQGIGTIVLLDLLREHGKINLLRRVTLIEPSTEALKRAVINVRLLCPELDIVAINKYLPGDGSLDEVEDINVSTGTVIDIFSNILDIETVNIQSLAKLVASISGHQFIFCIGPMNSGYLRLHQFAGMFSNTKNISKILEPKFGYTKTTNHMFSCTTNCFEYNGTEVTEILHPYAPVLVNGQRVYDDYDDNMLLINNVLDDKEYALYLKIKEGLTADDSVFIRPTIGGDTPLMVIIRPTIGVLLVTSHSDYMDVEGSLMRINSYQRNLFELHVKDLFIKAITNSKHWALIQKLIFIKDSSIDAFVRKLRSKKNIPEDKTLYPKDVQYTKFIDISTLNAKSGVELLHEVKMDDRNELFKPMLYKNFMKAMSGNWHSFKAGIDITPSREQKVLMESRPAHQKINGVAGSGKTQVLAARAVNAHLRTGKHVLVLSYNITLTNYLEMRIDNVRKDFSWDMFDIMNYHQFFNAQAHNVGYKTNELSDYEYVTFFEGAHTMKYAAIFVDEVQDYKEEWLIILQKYFLEEGGEFVVFGDSKQNIYQRELDVNGDIKLGTIRGVWNNSLGRSFRFINQKLAILSNKFQERYYDDAHYVPIEAQLGIEFEKSIYYYSISRTADAVPLYQKCKEIMDEYADQHPDEDTRTSFVILSQSVDVLRNIETEYFKEYGRGKTMTTFETQEQYDEVKAQSRNFSDDIDNIRASKKRHFKCGSALIKLSTIHSFKGWESLNVILILQPEGKQPGQTYHVTKKEDEKELIYTGITRAKNKLFIVDMGNERYGSFFKEMAKNG